MTAGESSRSLAPVVVMIRFHALGTLELRAADGRAHLAILAQPKRTALLAYLAVASPRGYHRRDTLLGLFWPESATERARHSLNQAIYAIRSILGAGVLVSRGSEEVGLAPDALWCDATAVEAALEAGELEAGLDLYHGDFLPGFFLSEAPEFEHWLETRRSQLRDRAVDAAWRLAEHAEGAGNQVGAAHWARRAAALVPEDEVSLRRLVALLDRCGDRAGALAAYQAFARRLAAEYEADPSPETTQLLQEVRAAAGPSSPLVSPPSTGRPVVPISPGTSTPAGRPELPVPPTPFVGREAELTAVHRLLGDPGCRLVTLIGLGGSGKTRLALQVGRGIQERFADGVCFVPLAPVGSASLLPSTLAKVLDRSLAGARHPEEHIFDALAGREMLLILDNFEHLLEAAGFVAQLLERAPRVKLLVTSRAALNLRGETLCSVAGLSIPGEESSAQLENSGAGRLFLQAARRAQPEWPLTDEDRPWAARICRLVDGLPLAIELAAAWLRILSCQELCREIERTHAFLAAPLRDAPERHRSLKAAFASSWQHLTDEERSVFRHLAVFRGGFRREAATAVAGASDVLLLALVDKALLRRLPSGRFEMLEVLRHFAEQHLEQESEAVRDRHCSYYAAFLREREPALAGVRQGEVLAEIGEEIANLREAWQWAVARGRAADLATALEGLFVFYDIRGWHQEAEEAFALAGRALAERAGHGGGTGPPGTRARLLARQGVFALRLGEYEKARELVEHSVSLSRSRADQGEVAFSLDRLGVILYNLGRHTEARQCQEESLAIRRALGDDHGVATSLNNLGSLAYAVGDYPEARRRCAEALVIQRQRGDRGGAVLSLQNLGYIALVQGEERHARQRLEEALTEARESGSSLLLARALNHLGNLANALGTFGEARSHFEQALAAALENGAASVALDALVGLSVLLSRVGDKEQALEILASALQHPAAERESREAAGQLLVALKAELPPQSVEAVLARAGRHTLEEILASLRVAPAPVRG